MDRDEELEIIVETFRAEAAELVRAIADAIVTLEKTRSEEERIRAADAACRHAHSLKGAAATVGLQRVSLLLHHVEDVLAALRDNALAMSQIVADELFTSLDTIDSLASSGVPGDGALQPSDEALVDRLQALLRVVPSAADERDDAGEHATRPSPEPAQATQTPSPIEPAQPQSSNEEESARFVRISQAKLGLVLDRIQELSELKLKMESVMRGVLEVDELLSPLDRDDVAPARRQLQALARGISDETEAVGKVLMGVQNELQSLRMVPFRSVFPLLRRAIRDLQRHVRGEIHLELSGGELELDRKIVDNLTSPLIHLLRNAAVHGIEPPEVRARAGKSKAGNVLVRIGYRGSDVCVEVADDGRGIDFEAVRTKAAELGLIPGDGSEISRAEMQKLLFIPGMSTQTTANALAGRGVGLDAVKRAVEALRGRIDIDTTPDRGTVFRITLPLTLATDVGLFVVARTQRFLIPRSAVLRVLIVAREDMLTHQDVSSLWFEGQHVPMVRLEPSLDVPPFVPLANQSSFPTLLLRSAESVAAVVVDAIEEEEEIVVRTLGSFLQGAKRLSGLTVTASGQTFFVLNPAELVRSATTPQGRIAKPIDRIDREERKLILVVDDSATSRLLNQKMLMASGFDVVTASDGAQALSMLDNHACDLVLSDVNMPEMDGFELTRRLKSDLRSEQIPVILLTSADRQEDRRRGVEVGADAYLIKNELSQTALMEVIDQLI